MKKLLLVLAMVAAMTLALATAAPAMASVIGINGDVPPVVTPADNVLDERIPDGVPPGPGDHNDCRTDVCNDH